MADEHANKGRRAGDPTVASVTISINEEQAVSGLLTAPEGAKACLVLAHGAGAGMSHPFMSAVASGLADRGVATLRYQFLYMERGSRRPDPPPIAMAVVKAAVNLAAGLLPARPLFAGGKSFGGRMTSQAAIQGALPGARGLIFFGFPLHPAGKPSTRRADHLARVILPMLFLQGTRDKLAEAKLLRPLVERLGRNAFLHEMDGADHSFHVPRRSGRSDEQAFSDMLDVAVDWMMKMIETVQ